MPTNKPIIQSYLDSNTYKKLKVLCINEDRTESKKAKLIITEYIKNYEIEHGEIVVDDEE